MNAKNDPHVKKPFILETVAREDWAEAGMLLFKRPSRKAFLVQETHTTVRNAVEGKLKRVRENAGLYADKIAEYEGILRRLDDRCARGHEEAKRGVAMAMLEHGDARIDASLTCCVLALSPGKWLVFGYA